MLNRLRPLLVKALSRTGLLLLIYLVLSTVLGLRLLGPVSDFLEEEQNAALDGLTRVVYRLGGPKAQTPFPPVLFVELDLASVERLSPKGNVFHREALARVVQKTFAYRPAGVLIDLDLSQPSNEGGLPSEGDKKLLEVLRKAPHPVLLSDPLLLGQAVPKQPNLLVVSSQILYEADGVARWIPGAEDTPCLPAALALYGLGTGQTLKPCRAEGLAGHIQVLGFSGGVGERIVFRKIRRFEANHSGRQPWPGLTLISGVDLLAGRLDKTAADGAVVVIGRTYPPADDLHFTPVRPGGGGLPGVEFHLNALMTLVTYGHFASGLKLIPVLILLLVAVFLVLVLVYWLSSKLVRFRTLLTEVLEGSLSAFCLFWLGVVLVQRYGYFVDYALPVLALHLVLLLFKVYQEAKGESHMA